MLRSRLLSGIAPFSVFAALMLGACAAPTPQTIIQTSPPQIQTQVVLATQLVTQLVPQTQIVVATTAPVTPAPTATAAPTTVVNAVPAVPGYTVTVFAQGVDPTKNPDDITLMGGNIFVGNQNGIGSDGKASSTGVTQSTIQEYDSTGKVVATWQITGKCDGLTADPANNRLIATVNEDSNSSMYVITPGAAQGQQVQPITYTLPAGQKASFGGTDHITIVGSDIYIVGSAPKPDAGGNVTSGVLYKAVINADNTATLTPVLLGNAKANDLAPGATAGATVKLNIGDPDSSNLVPAESPLYAGQFALVGQGDKTLIFIDKIGTSGQVNSALPIGNEMNDLVWATSATGTLYLTDTSANKIYAIKGNFKPGTAFMAAPGDSGVAGFLATVDLKSGLIKPIVVGMGSPHGLLFVP